MRNTDNEGDRFGFCFHSDQYDQRIPSLTFLLLTRCKAKPISFPDLSHQRNLSSLFLQNSWDHDLFEMTSIAGLQIYRTWGGGLTLKHSGQMGKQ